MTLALIALATVTAVWVGKDSELFRDFVAHEVGRLLQRSVQIGDLDIGLGPELDSDDYMCHDRCKIAYTK